jgi:hypothetical protein
MLRSTGCQCCGHGRTATKAKLPTDEEGCRGEEEKKRKGKKRKEKKRKEKKRKEKKRKEKKKEKRKKKKEQKINK